MLLPRAVRTIASKPIRTVLRWQLYVAVALTLVAGWWAGAHGAISALLGGIVNLAAGLVYAMMVSPRGRAKSAGEMLRTLIRAEASKIALIVLQLWLVLTTYHDVVLIVFFAAFAISVLVFPMALLVRD
ncbi:MAG: ATP synthase subunit I [Betaproteobacteria bacterium]|nr:ATP synthase subunit I [Betaproteobacteria bacterium]